MTDIPDSAENRRDIIPMGEEKREWVRADLFVPASVNERTHKNKKQIRYVAEWWVDVD